MSRLACLFPLVLLAGCASAGGARTLAPGSDATLAPGDAVTLPDASQLTYVGTTSDSRCRPDVQCIHAGNATVAFRHAAGASSREVRIDTRDGRAELGDWWLTLVSLDFAAPPNATVRVDAVR